MDAKIIRGIQAAELDGGLAGRTVVLVIDGEEVTVKGGNLNAVNAEPRVFAGKRFYKLRDIDLADGGFASEMAAAADKWGAQAEVKLDLQDAGLAHDRSSAGVIPSLHYYDDLVLRAFTPPMLYPPIVISDSYAPISGGAVIPVGTRRYRITLHKSECGRRSPGDSIEFSETFDMPSPFTVYGLSTDGRELSLSPATGSDLVFFGTPRFRQDAVIPAFQGKAAYLLFSIANGWGDNGTENVFVSLGEDGRPVAAFHEASCS